MGGSDRALSSLAGVAGVAGSGAGGSGSGSGSRVDSPAPGEFGDRVGHIITARGGTTLDEPCRHVAWVYSLAVEIADSAGTRQGDR